MSSVEIVLLTPQFAIHEEIEGEHHYTLAGTVMLGADRTYHYSFQIDGIDRDDAMRRLHRGFTALMLWSKGGRQGDPPEAARQVRFYTWAPPLYR